MVETLTWETQTDWDNAVSANQAIAKSGVIELGIGVDDFESYSTGTSAPGPWQDPNNAGHTVSTNSAYEGSNSYMYGTTTIAGTNDFYTLATCSAFPAHQYTYDLEYTYREPETNQTSVVTHLNDSGEVILRFGWDNPGPVYDGASSGAFSQPSPDYSEYRRWIVNYDWANTQVTLTWTDLTGSSSDQSTTIGLKSVSGAYNLAEVRFETVDFIDPWEGDEWDQSTVDLVHAIRESGDLETATKSFASSKTPDLQNLSYSLNGESITLDVIGSPGTASEEIVSQTLDGSTSYSLSWSSSHTDFRIKVNLDTTDPTISPTFDAVSLVPQSVTLNGTVTYEGSAVSGAYVVAYNKSTETFEGFDVTDSNGNYTIAVGYGDTILVSVDYYDSGSDTYYGDGKSIVVS